MNIFKFVASLLPTFDRSRMSENVDRLRSDITGTLQPSLKTAEQLVGSREFVSPGAKTFSDLFHHAMPKHRSQPVFKALAKIFNDLPAKLDMIDDLIEATFAKDVARESLTYKKAAILQYLNTMHFVVSYTSMALMRYVAAETAVLNGHPDQVDTQWAPAQLTYLNNNLSSYMDALRVIDLPVAETRKQLESIPEITVDAEKAQIAKNTVGTVRLDPLKLNLLGGLVNPIYTMRASIAEYQVREYKRQVEEKKQLELRLLALREAYQGKQDPKLAQHIAYSEGRLQRLNFELAKTAETEFA